MPTREELLKLLDQMTRLEQGQIALAYSVLADLEDPAMREAFQGLLSDELKHVDMLRSLPGR